MAAAKGKAKKVEDFFGATAFGPEAFKDTYEKFAQNMSEFANFQKDTMEAMSVSANVFAKGVETAVAAQSNFVKDYIEEGVEAAKSASSSSSVQEAIEVQSTYARTAIEKNIGHATKMSEHWVSVSKEAAEPVTKRYGEFLEFVQTHRP